MSKRSKLTLIITVAIIGLTGTSLYLYQKWPWFTVNYNYFIRDKSYKLGQSLYLPEQYLNVNENRSFLVLRKVVPMTKEELLSSTKPDEFTSAPKDISGETYCIAAADIDPKKLKELGSAYIGDYIGHEKAYFKSSHEKDLMYNTVYEIKFNPALISENTLIYNKVPANYKFANDAYYIDVYHATDHETLKK